MGVFDRLFGDSKKRKPECEELSQEERKKIYRAFMKIKKQESSKSIEKIVRGVRIYPGQSPAAAIAQAVVSQRMKDNDPSRG